MAQASYFSVSSEQFIQHIIQHGQVQNVLWRSRLTARCQDVLMDWSLLRPHARFGFLRDELLYSSHIPVHSVLFSPAVPH